METQEIQKPSQVSDKIRGVRKCPGCGSITIATPVLTCSHCGQEVPIRCFYYKAGSKFYAQCLDLNLISRGETAEEAVGRLQEAMVGYVIAVLEGGSSKGLIPRPAPFFSWLRFYLHRIAAQARWWSVKRDKNHNAHFHFSGEFNCRCD